MKRKIFIPYPLTPNQEFGVFKYDFTPSIIKQMRCDEYGFYHSKSEEIILKSEKDKQTHLVQGWDLGNGNVLSLHKKIIECADFYCESNQTYYVAYTSPCSSDKEELYTIYLYSIPISDKNEAVFLNRGNNVFDSYEPQQVFNLGINGNLSFSQIGADVFLKWQSKSYSSAADMKSYSYNLIDGSIYIDSSNLRESTYRCISKVIADNTVSHIHFHKVCNDEDLYVCVIEPVAKERVSPAIVVCLGGPNIPIPNFADSCSIYERFRQEGFFVIIPLRRGIIGISPEWTNGINNNVGTIDVDDILRGVVFATTGYSKVMDINRIGIYGASYGGFSSLLIAGKHNETCKFKAIVSHCGMSDLERYPYECYGNPSDVMDYYAGNEDFLQKTKDISPYNYIRRWEVPVLLVHTIDDTSVWFGQSVRAYNEGIKYGKKVDLILAPGPHSYDIQNGKHLINLIVEFFFNNLTH